MIWPARSKCEPAFLKSGFPCATLLRLPLQSCSLPYPNLPFLPPFLPPSPTPSPLRFSLPLSPFPLPPSFLSSSFNPTLPFPSPSPSLPPSQTGRLGIGPRYHDMICVTHFKHCSNEKKPLTYENSTCFSHICVFFTWYKIWYLWPLPRGHQHWQCLLPGPCFFCIFNNPGSKVASLLLEGYAIATITLMRQACTCGPVWAPVPSALNKWKSDVHIINILSALHCSDDCTCKFQERKSIESTAI